MNCSDFKRLVTKNRSFRRFDQKGRISRARLRKLVDLARLTPSAGNIQPLKYLISNEPQRNAKIFACLAWASYLTSWSGPAASERPTAYIIMLADRSLKPDCACDLGIAAQTIMLGATAAGLGGCMLGSLQRERLRRVLKIAKRYEILLVLALGQPAEKVVLERAQAGQIRYWRDQRGRQHVPKRTLQEIILE